LLKPQNKNMNSSSGLVEVGLIEQVVMVGTIQEEEEEEEEGIEEEEEKGNKRTHHRRGKKRPHKPYYEMTEKER
jgi:hypothetical protein